MRLDQVPAASRGEVETHPLNGLNHASLGGEEAGDVLAVVGHVGNSFRRDRLYRLTSFLPTVRSPPGSISKVSPDDGFHRLGGREFRKSLNTIGRPSIRWHGTTPLHAIALIEPVRAAEQLQRLLQPDAA